ncbi:MAG TPA: DUF1684 domain-containing protein [Chryseosolibacter sp.]
MKTNRIIAFLALGVVVITIIYSFLGSQDDTAYIKKIEEERREKDRFMRASPESPFAKAPGEYKGLKYFPPDIHYRVVAQLQPIRERKPVILSTNDGDEQRYVEYAHAVFNLDGVSNRLLILEIADPGPSHGNLFLAFGDETSARETYGAGRYLDVAKVPGSNTITLDFNLAYNPYCAYSDTYSCPLPPRENILAIPIKAGEKSYH